MTHARPLSPTFELIVPSSDGSVHPMFSSRSPSVTPVIATASECLFPPLRKIPIGNNDIVAGCEKP